MGSPGVSIRVAYPTFSARLAGIWHRGRDPIVGSYR